MYLITLNTVITFKGKYVIYVEIKKILNPQKYLRVAPLYFPSVGLLVHQFFFLLIQRFVDQQLVSYNLAMQDMRLSLLQEKEIVNIEIILVKITSTKLKESITITV